MESKANKQPILPRESNTGNTSMEKNLEQKKKEKKNDEHLWFAEMRWSEPTIDRRRRRPRRRGLDRSTVDSISTLHLSARECSTSDASTANRIGLLSSKTPPDRHGSYRGRILKLIGSKKKTTKNKWRPNAPIKGPNVNNEHLLSCPISGNPGQPM